MDECTGSPCKNGALCQNVPGSYRCSCKSGFAGRNCQRGLWTQETTFLGLTELSSPQRHICDSPIFNYIAKKKQTNNYNPEKEIVLTLGKKCHISYCTLIFKY